MLEKSIIGFDLSIHSIFPVESSTCVFFTYIMPSCVEWKNCVSFEPGREKTSLQDF